MPLIFGREMQASEPMTTIASTFLVETPLILASMITSYRA
jgi:hypothetical protein